MMRKKEVLLRKDVMKGLASRPCWTRQGLTGLYDSINKGRPKAWYIHLSTPLENSLLIVFSDDPQKHCN